MSPDKPASSPLGPPSSTGSRKPKKPAPVTPRRFNRFFTPRSTKPRSQRALVEKSGLLDGNLPSEKPGKNSHRSKEPGRVFFQPDAPTHPPRTPSCSPNRNKKRKLMLSPDSSPLEPSPSKRVQFTRPSHHNISIWEEDPEEQETDIEVDIDDDDDKQVHVPAVTPARIQRSKLSGPNSRLLLRSFGGLSVTGRGWNGPDHCTSAQHQTANFYSGRDDVHTFRSRRLPFCAAGAPQGGLVAIGDEEGGVRILDTTSSSVDGTSNHTPFNTPHLFLRPHDNAVMDLDFSYDGWLLATGCGDQTARIIDMHTQQTKDILEAHKSSVKQIRFQPNSHDVVATSSRDGNVQLWDLRCSGRQALITEYAAQTHRDRHMSQQQRSHKVSMAPVYSTISCSHWDQSVGLSTRERDTHARREPPSVTALSFLPQAGREHLLLTSSEASTSVRLWDIRGRYSGRGFPTPMAETRQPESHLKHRPFGINSLCLSGDGSRLYALSRDNTVYAYSTNHLVLNDAPELSYQTDKRSRYYANSGKEGLGPMYGFRHPRLHATTFYIKLALRPARDDRPEMLAVGSSDSCAVLFPTDEKVLGGRAMPPTPVTPNTGVRPALKRSTSGFGAASRLVDNVPIYEHGTPLTRAHAKEVTGVTWSTNGSLVTIGDDYSARVWREGPEAEKLRTQGESEGRRWQSGWAEVEEGYDDDDCEG